MKYFFLAIAFFSLGYAIPTLTPVLQMIIAGFTLLFLTLMLYIYVDKLAYLKISDEN